MHCRRLICYYGTTADHVVSLDVVLVDGTVATIGAGHDSLADRRETIDRLVELHAGAIRERLSEGLLKRHPGYGLDRYLESRGDLTRMITGSEGTLAGIMSAELKVVPLPREKGLGVICFACVPDALQAAVELRDLRPAAIEHVDRILFDQTRGKREFRAVRSLLRLDEEPCESMLLVEFFEEVEDKLAGLSRRRLGLRTVICADDAEMEQVWSLRKTGLSLLTGCKGPAKPTAAIEDVAVRPEQLPDYVAGLRSILKPLGVEASYYGHAAAGLLHVRPVLDLHAGEGVRQLRHIAGEVFALTRQFDGSIAGEHGVGIARTEYLAAHLGGELTAVTREVKAVFDPKGVMNPGKIVSDGRYRIDTNLRQEAGREIALPFAPILAFIEKDGSFVSNLEQCNGCGGCVKRTPTMCPTYIATGEEIMSTRGRANVIRAVLEHRLDGDGDPLASHELEAALTHCLSCKACKTECPSNVDMALLKAELIHAGNRRAGVRLRDWLIGGVDTLGRIGCAIAPIANAALNSPATRWLMEKTLGITAKRPLPAYASQRFDRWFTGRTKSDTGKRGRVILWDDTFVRYHEPHVGMAAVAVLEAAGYDVVLADGRQCCGRPAFSRGLLDEVARLGRYNVDLLRRAGQDPIIFLEPSCYSMFVDDYCQLDVPGTERVARRCFLLEDFVCGVLDREPDALSFDRRFRRVAVHVHCHARALTDVGAVQRLAEYVPNTSVRLLDCGCCGMAGAFGVLAPTYELSVRVAGPLVESVNHLPPETQLVACGTSCRHQVSHLTRGKPIHMAELLAGALSHATERDQEHS